MDHRQQEPRVTSQTLSFDHRLCRSVDRVAHRPAGMQMHDGVVPVVVQPEDREPDPVQVGQQDGVAELFGWYEAGTVTVPSEDECWSFRVDERSAQMLREVLAATGALVCGRRLFDRTGSTIRLSSPAAASPTCATPYGILETGPALPPT